jgi:hypothetical protein
MWKILNKSNGQELIFKTDSDFCQWYDNTHLAQYESSVGAMDQAKDQQNGYYIGLGYYLNYIDIPDYVSYPPKKEETKTCQHPRKYLNKISNSLEFMVCPDCKEEVKEEPVVNKNTGWEWGF